MPLTEALKQLLSTLVSQDVTDAATGSVVVIFHSIDTLNVRKPVVWDTLGILASATITTLRVHPNGR